MLDDRCAGTGNDHGLQRSQGCWQRGRHHPRRVARDASAAARTGARQPEPDQGAVRADGRPPLVLRWPGGLEPSGRPGDLGRGELHPAGHEHRLAEHGDVLPGRVEQPVRRLAHRVQHRHPAGSQQQPGDRAGKLLDAGDDHPLGGQQRHHDHRRPDSSRAVRPDCGRYPPRAYARRRGQQQHLLRRLLPPRQGDHPGGRELLLGLLRLPRHDRERGRALARSITASTPTSRRVRAASPDAAPRPRSSATTPTSPRTR